MTLADKQNWSTILREILPNSETADASCHLHTVLEVTIILPAISNQGLDNFSTTRHIISKITTSKKVLRSIVGLKHCYAVPANCRAVISAWFGKSTIWTAEIASKADKWRHFLEIWLNQAKKSLPRLKIGVLWLSLVTFFFLSMETMLSSWQTLTLKQFPWFILYIFTHS